MDFPQLKKQTIDCLQTLESIGNELRSPEKVKFVPAGIQKLKENKFTVVIAGEFSRGKTTLLKALAGGLEYLPDANQANTSTITSIEYSEDQELLDQFKIIFRDDREDLMLHKDEIKKYVAQDPSVKRDEIDEIERICIWSDLPYLKEGIQIVDSPGLGSIYPHHRDITYDQIAQSDACIFLMLIRPAAGASEISFLKDIQKHLNKVFFILNQCDIDDLLKKPEVLTEEVDKIAAQLHTQDITGFKREHLFPMSSQWAFAGKAKEKAHSILEQRAHKSWEDYFKSVEIEDFETLYELSGFKPFENFFEDFIYSGEKAREILMAPIKRIQNCIQEFKEYIELRLINLNDDVSVEELTEKIDLIKGRLELFKSKSEDTLKETELKFEDLIKESERQSEKQFERARNKIKEEVQVRAGSFHQINDESTQESIGIKVTREVNKVIDNLVDLIQVGIDDLIVTQQRSDQKKLTEILDNIESDIDIKMPKIELPKVYFNESALEEYDRRISTQLKEKTNLEQQKEVAKKEEDTAKREYEKKQKEAFDVGKNVRWSEEHLSDLREEKPLFIQWQDKVIVDTIEEPYNHTYIQEKKWGWRLKFWPHKKQWTETRTRSVNVYGFKTKNNGAEIETYNEEIKKEKNKLRSYKEKLADLVKNANSREEQLNLKQNIREKIEAAEDTVNAKIRGLEAQKRKMEAEMKEKEMKRFMSESMEMIDDMVNSQIRFGKREIKKNVRKYYEIFKQGISTEYDSQIINLEGELKKLLADKHLQEEEKKTLITFLSNNLEKLQILQQNTASIETSILDHQTVS